MTDVQFKVSVTLAGNGVDEHLNFQATATQPDTTVKNPGNFSVTKIGGGSGFTNGQTVSIPFNPA